MNPDPKNRQSAASLFWRVYDLDGHDERPTSERPLVRLCALILLECLASGAQDLQLAIIDGTGIAKVCQQGSWKDMMTYPTQMHDGIVNRLKVMANLDVAKRPVQSGELRVRGHDRQVRIGIEVRKQPSGAEEASLHFPAVAGTV